MSNCYIIPAVGRKNTHSGDCKGKGTVLIWIMLCAIFCLAENDYCSEIFNSKNYNSNYHKNPLEAL